MAKKRFRDQESTCFRRIFGRIERLTRAAVMLETRAADLRETGRFNPESRRIDDLANRVGASSLRLAFALIVTAGAVFYRQSAGAMAIVGDD